MNEHPSESGLMRATARNIDSLQRAVASLQESAVTAKTDAAEAREAATEAREEAKRWKALNGVLGIIILVTMVASSLSVYNWVQNSAATNQLRNQAITSCQDGNSVRKAQVGVWDAFFTLALKGNKDPKARVFVTTFEHTIAKALAPRDCTKAYNPQALQ